MATAASYAGDRQPAQRWLTLGGARVRSRHVLALTLLVALTASAALVELGRRADRARDHEVVAARVETSIARFRALPWDLLTPRRPTAGDEKTRLEATVARDIASLDADGAAAGRIQALYEPFRAAIGRQTALIRSNDLDAAGVLQRERVDPAYDRLALAVAGTRESLRLNARDAIFLQTIASVLVLVVAVALLAVAWLLLDRARRLRSEADARRRAMAEQNEELRRLHRLADEYVAGMPHEHPIPLASLPQLVAPLLEEGAARPVEPLPALKRDVDEALALTNDLVFMLEAHTGLAELEFERVDLAPLVHAAFERDGVLLRNGDSAVVQGDPARLRQLATVLADVVCAMRTPDSAATVRVACGRGDARLEIEVPSLRTAGHPEPADPSGDPRTALRLAVADAIVETHGGSLELRTSRFGTTIRVALPLAATAAVAV